MKKYTFIILILGFLVNVENSNAQSAFKNGIRAGLSLVNLHGDNVENNQELLSFNGGYYVDYSFSSHFSIQPEINLVFEGASKAEVNSFPFSKVSISYIQIPVLFKINPEITWADKIKPSFFVGPALNVNVSKDLEGEIFENASGAFSPEQKVNSTAWDCVLGARATIKDLYFLDLRYGYGLSDVFENGDIKSQSFTLSLGFVF